MKNVPALRFPDFNGDWVEVVLNEFSDIKTGPFGSSLHQEDYVLEGTPIVTVEHLSDFGLVHSNLPRVTDKDKLRLKSYTLLENDIVFSRVGSVDRNSLIKETEAGWLFSGRLLRIRIINKELIDAAFLSNIFQSDYTKYRIRSVAVGQTMASLNTQILKNFNVLVSPNIAEQQKIAAFLTAVDDKIQQLSKKKSLLEQYKKGVMQQVFSQKIRFKDDQRNEYPDWEEKKLGEVGDTFNGLTGKTKENFGIGHPYVTYKQIFDNSKIDVNKFALVDVSNNESQTMVKFGDVFFTTSSETANEIGYSSVLLDEVKRLYLNSFCFGYRVHSFEAFSPYYARYLFRSPSFRKDIMKLAQGSTRYNMSKVGLMKQVIDLPSLSEQTKIANFLSAIDQKINHISQQLEQTRRFKKGLLQQMFV